MAYDASRTRGIFHVPLRVDGDLSFGQYNHATIQSPGVPQQDGTIANQAMHEWLLVGARVDYFP